MNKWGRGKTCEFKKKKILFQLRRDAIFIYLDVNHQVPRLAIIFSRRQFQKAGPSYIIKLLSIFIKMV